MRTRLIATIVLACLPGLAFAQGMPGMNMGDGAAGKANMETMRRMQADMTVASTGNPDRDFATMMRPHHRGAVEMAAVELRYGKGPELRRMAREIVASQKREI